MNLIKLLPLLLLTISSLCFGLGRTVSYKGIKTHAFGAIQNITPCGNWQDSDDNNIGHFRAIEVFHSGRDMLFADVVQVTENDQYVARVKMGFTFSEINNDHADITIEHVTCSADGVNKIRIDVDALNPDGNPYHFTLFIDGVSHSYRYLKRP